MFHPYRRFRAWLLMGLHGEKAWKAALTSPDPVMTMALIEYGMQQSVRDQWTIYHWLHETEPEVLDAHVDDPEWMATQPLAVQRFVTFAGSRPEEP